jgi:hypothetical protein
MWTVSPIKEYEEYVTSAEALFMPTIPSSTIAAADGAALHRKNVSAIERARFIAVMPFPTLLPR